MDSITALLNPLKSDFSKADVIWSAMFRKIDIFSGLVILSKSYLS